MASNTSVFLIIVFFLLGVSTLFPFNSLLVAGEQFKSILSESVSWSSNIDTVSLFSYLLFNLFISTVLLRPLRGKADRISALTGYATQIALFVILLILFSSKGSLINATADGIIITFLHALCGVATGLIQVHVFSVVGQLSPFYSSVLLFGQGISGVIPSLFNYILAVWGRADDNYSMTTQTRGTIFFSFCLICMVFCMCLLIFLPKWIHNELVRINSPHVTEMKSDSTCVEKTPCDASDVTPLNLLQLFRVHFPIAISLFSTLALTLVFIPVAAINVQDVNPQKSVNTPLVFFLYNTFDSLGRFIPQLLGLIYRVKANFSRNKFKSTSVPFNLARNTLVLCAILRLSLLFIFPITEFNNRKHSFFLIPHGFWVFALFSLLGLSNGAQIAACFGLGFSTMVPVLDGSGNKRITNKTREMTGAEKGSTARILTFSLMVGLLTGSLLNFGYKALFFK